MLEFIQLLKQRYQTVLIDQKNPQHADFKNRIEQLHYAEAFIRKGQLLDTVPLFPLQIAIIGPTQAGKSSIANVLLNSDQAGISPLAGYTVHPHGYCHQIHSDQCSGLQQYFGRFQCLAEAQLTRNRYDCYSLSETDSNSKLIPPAVIWDTPDFDSIDASDYREGVIRTIALADILVLVVSKEKYADQSVWELVQILETFRQPTVICLNKLTEGNETVLVNSLKSKWQHYRKDPVPAIIPLSFQKYGAMPVWPAVAEKLVLELLGQVDPKKHQHKQINFINQHWNQWLEPVRAEQHALQTWHSMVDTAISEALVQYQKNYLDHPHHYETFNQAILNLLKLLEIPGIASAVTTTRRALTWPIRKLFGLSKSANAKSISHEHTVLFQIGEHLLIKIADQLAQKAETDAIPVAWWKETSSALRDQKTPVMNAFVMALEDYQEHFQSEVELAAHQLYSKLQEQPMTLNSLRATRVSTDVAAMILTIQTGGIGIHDLFITPVMLTVTSLLAESAIGSYMKKVERELKLHQLQTVERSVLDQSFRERLYRLPHQVHSKSRFNLDESLCLQMESQLKEKKNGLRLL